MPLVPAPPCGPVASKPSANSKPKSKNTRLSYAKITNGDANALFRPPKRSPEFAPARLTIGRRAGNSFTRTNAALTCEPPELCSRTIGAACLAKRRDGGSLDGRIFPRAKRDLILFSGKSLGSDIVSSGGSILFARRPSNKLKPYLSAPGRGKHER